MKTAAFTLLFALGLFGSPQQGKTTITELTYQVELTNGDMRYVTFSEKLWQPIQLIGEPTGMMTSDMLVSALKQVNGVNYAYTIDQKTIGVRIDSLPKWDEVEKNLIAKVRTLVAPGAVVKKLPDKPAPVYPAFDPNRIPVWVLIPKK